jgi:hypothetical protein
MIMGSELVGHYMLFQSKSIPDDAERHERFVEGIDGVGADCRASSGIFRARDRS